MSTEKPVATKWARYSDYEIVDGAVQPVQGAAIEFYDPWLEYREQTRTSSGQGGPHDDLLRLVRVIQEPIPLVGLRREDKARILEWCRHWGLLGLWHQQTLQVTFEVALEGGEPWATEDGVAVVQRGYTSANGTWQPYTESRSVGAMILRGTFDPALEKTLLDGSLDLVPWERRTKRIYREGISSSTYEVDFSYTPNADHPLSEAFWGAYKETLSDLWMGLAEIASAIEKRTPETLLGSAKPVLAPAEGAAWTTTWACPSLVSALGAMAMTDLMGGRILRYCKHCGLPFVATNPLQFYCADPEPCQSTAKKQRYRSRVRDRE